METPKEIVVVCEQCFRVTTKETTEEKEKAQKTLWVACHACGTFVRVK